MNFSRWFLSLVLLGFSSSIVMADGIDPKMGLIGGGGSTGLFSPDDTNFKFFVRGGDFTSIGQSLPFDFINATNHLAVGVDLVVTLLEGTNPLIFTCVPSSEYFTNCSPQTPTTLFGGGSLLIRFFDPNNGEGGFGGIPFATDLTSPEQCDGIENCSTDTPGADFAVQVTDVGGDLVNLPTGKGFMVQGTLIVPEPSTVLLVLAGGILLFLFKRS